MIKTKKQDWEDMIWETKAFWQDGKQFHVDRAIKVSIKISSQCGVDWTEIKHLVECVFADGGFVTEQPEAALYDILKILGIEVE